MVATATGGLRVTVTTYWNTTRVSTPSDTVWLPAEHQPPLQAGVEGNDATVHPGRLQVPYISVYPARSVARPVYEPTLRFLKNAGFAVSCLTVTTSAVVAGMDVVKRSTPTRLTSRSPCNDGACTTTVTVSIFDVAPGVSTIRSAS